MSEMPMLHGKQSAFRELSSRFPPSSSIYSPTLDAEKLPILAWKVPSRLSRTPSSEDSKWTDSRTSHTHGGDGHEIHSKGLCTSSLGT
jgi:hypothetical protein